MTEQQPTIDLNEKIDQFIASTTHLHNRLTELEKATAWLLMKDPEWLAEMEKRLQEEEKAAAEFTEQAKEMQE